MLPYLLDNRKPDAKKLNEILNMLGLADRRRTCPVSCPAASSSAYPSGAR